MHSIWNIIRVVVYFWRETDVIGVPRFRSKDFSYGHTKKFSCPTDYFIVYFLSCLIQTFFQSHLTGYTSRFNWADFHFSRFLLSASVPFSPDEAGRNPLHRPHFQMFRRTMDEQNSSTSSITSMGWVLIFLFVWMDAGYNSISLILFLVPYKNNADEHFLFFLLVVVPFFLLFYF